MKFELSSLDLHYLIKEFKILEDAKVDRIYNAADNKEEFLFTFHKTGEGKKLLKIILPSLIFLDEGKDLYENPTGFCMMLRKYLEGSRLRKIDQKDFERIIVMEFESKQGDKQETLILVVELFSKGNIIFCDSALKILNLYEQQHWSERELKKNEIYKFPKSLSNPLTMTAASFAETLSGSSRDLIVKSLATDFSLGGKYAELLCTESGIDKSAKTRTIDSKKLYPHFKSLFEKTPKAMVCNGILYPFNISSENLPNLSNLSGTKESYDSYSKAIAVNYSRFTDNTAAKIMNKNLARIQAIIDEQEEKLKEYTLTSADYQRKAELIYEHYKELAAIIETIRTARKKYSWKDIKAKLANDPKFKELIKDIDEKNQEIVVDLERL